MRKLCSRFDGVRVEIEHKRMSNGFSRSLRRPAVSGATSRAAAAADHKAFVRASSHCRIGNLQSGRGARSVGRLLTVLVYVNTPKGNDASIKRQERLGTGSGESEAAHDTRSDARQSTRSKSLWTC